VRAASRGHARLAAHHHHDARARDDRGDRSHPRQLARRAEPAGETSTFDACLDTLQSGRADAAAHAGGERAEVLLARIVLERRAQALVLRTQPGQRVATIGARFQVALGLVARPAFERAVEQRTQLVVREVLHGSSPPRVRTSARSSARARERRDITVPAGTPSAFAISSYERPSTTRKVSTA
jgi:hypothetical protein